MSKYIFIYAKMCIHHHHIIIIIINILFITLTCDFLPGMVCQNQTLKSAAATEEWHYQKPTITINFGNSLGPGTT